MVNLVVLVAALSLVAVTSAARCNGIRDTLCLNKDALKFANRIRAASGKREVSLGYLSQQKNADNHARDIMTWGTLRHQSMGDATVKVGCGLFINAENIAYTYPSMMGTMNIAEKCMDMFEKSPPHRENIINDNSDMMNIGFSERSDGSLWCVMTMSIKMLATPPGNLCKSIASSGTPSTVSEPPPPIRSRNTMNCYLRESVRSGGKVDLSVHNRKGYTIKIWKKSLGGSPRVVKWVAAGATKTFTSFKGDAYRITSDTNDCMRAFRIRNSNNPRTIVTSP